MSRAVCVRCGTSRPDFAATCPACGHRPVDDGLLVAWLLSTEHLGDAALDAAAERIRAGEAIRPSARQLDKARRAMGRAFATDPGLSLAQRLGLLATSLVLTPLPAWICFAWWVRQRPRAAWQSFGVALPGSVLYAALGVWLWIGPVLSARLGG